MHPNTGVNASKRPVYKKKNLASTVGAILSVGTLASVSPSSLVAQEAGSGALEEILVTASRREQLISDVPASVSALGGEQLDRMGANGLEDYFTAIPSLSLVDRGPGRNNIIIRGVSNDSSLFYGDPQTSALYFDEVPVSEGTYPDLHTFDVQRIEVLRGPQGTLYGAGSLGGAVRIITEKPDPGSLSARLDTTVEGISGHDVGTRLNFMVNAPLIKDKLAARLVGYSHDVAGFYENVNESRPDGDAGTEKLDGGRLAVRWLPTEKLTIDARAIIQSQEADGYPAEQDALPLDLAPFQHDFGSGGRLDDDIEIYNLDAAIDMDFATLTVATSYMDRDRIFIENVNRYTYYYGYDSVTQDYVNDGFGPNQDIFLPVSSLVTDDHFTFSGEVRLVSNGTGPLSYTLGAFYSDTTTNHGFVDYTDPADETHLSVLDDAACTFLGDDPCAPPYDAQAVLFDSDSFGDFDDTLRNTSVYGEFEYELNPHWTAIAGFRAFDLHMESDDPVVEDYDEDGISPKFGVQYRITDDTMLYALYSEGFRRGNYPSSLIRADQEQELAARLGGRLPGEYTIADQPIIDEVLLADDNLCGAAYPNFGRQVVESDSLKNHEIGAKLTRLDGRMQLNASGYFIKWENLQVLQVIDCGSGAGFFGTANGNQGDAEITGVEIDWSIQATERLYLNLSAGYTHSRLQEDANLFPAGNPFTLTGVFEEPLGVKGDRSPAVPEVAFSLSGTYTFPVPFLANDAYQGYLYFAYDYQGSSYTEYTRRPNERSGDFGLMDLRIGIAGDSWELSAFVKNVFDDDTSTYVDIIPLTLGNNITRVQPRTIGVNFTYSADF
jgi:outer membrane receptor protein involved in Fe transport